MSRLLVFPLLLIIVFTLAMGVFMLIGRFQPPPETVQWLHLTDCAPPCWNGITPGASSRVVMENRIEAAFPDFKLVSSDNISFATWASNSTSPGMSMNINVELANGIVTDTGISMDYPSDQMPRLGDIFAVFGTPTCVTFDDRAPTSPTFYYENTSHKIFFALSLFSPSLFSLVGNLAFGVQFNNANCQNLFGVSWLEYRKLYDIFPLIS